MQAYFPRKVKNSMFRKGISCKEFITVITTFIIALWMVGGSLFFLVPTFVQLLFLIILFVSLFLTNGIGGFRYIKKYQHSQSYSLQCFGLEILQIMIQAY